jgi:hypothetical protein
VIIAPYRLDNGRAERRHQMTTHTEIVCVAGFGYLGGVAPTLMIGSPSGSLQLHALIAAGICLGSSLGLIISNSLESGNSGSGNGRRVGEGFAFLVIALALVAIFTVPSAVYVNGLIKDLVLFYVIVPLQFLSAPTAASYTVRGFSIRHLWCDHRSSFVFVAHIVVFKLFSFAIILSLIYLGLHYLELYHTFPFFVSWLVITLITYTGDGGRGSSQTL